MTVDDGEPAEARLMTADDGEPAEARLMVPELRLPPSIWIDGFLHQVGDTVEARREGTWGHIGRIVHHCTRTDARSPYRDTYDVHFGAQVSFALSNGSMTFACQCSVRRPFALHR